MAGEVQPYNFEPEYGANEEYEHFIEPEGPEVQNNDNVPGYLQAWLGQPTYWCLCGN